MNTELITAKQTEWQTRYWLTNITRGEIIAEINNTPEAWGDHNTVSKYCAELFNVSVTQINDELKAYNTYNALIDIANTDQQIQAIHSAPVSYLAKMPNDLNPYDKIEILERAKTREDVTKLVKELKHNRDHQAEDHVNAVNHVKQENRDKKLAKLRANIETTEKSKAQALKRFEELDSTPIDFITVDSYEDNTQLTEPKDYFMETLGREYQGDQPHKDRAITLHKSILAKVESLAKDLAELRGIDDSMAKVEYLKYDVGIECI